MKGFGRHVLSTNWVTKSNQESSFISVSSSFYWTQEIIKDFWKTLLCKSFILQLVLRPAAGFFKYVWPFSGHQALKGEERDSRHCLQRNNLWTNFLMETSFSVYLVCLLLNLRRLKKSDVDNVSWSCTFYRE